MRWTVLALALVAGAAAARAEAHAMPNSSVVVQSSPGAVGVKLSIPLSELSAALGHPLRQDAEGRAELARYLKDHAAVVGKDGRAWAPEIRALGGEDSDHPALVATLVFAPPRGGAGQPASLRYDAVSHHIASHYVLVYRRSGGELRPLGRVQSPATVLRLP